jgi:prepilin signal peptidase PulO-like enzyme (type II secretory pathway)
MGPQTEVSDNRTLAAVRTRGLAYLNYVFWALAGAGVLVLFHLLASLLERWVGFLAWLRGVFGIPYAAGGPDWWMIAGVGTAAAALLGVVALIYSVYRRAWSARLEGVWEHGAPRGGLRLRRLAAVASEREVAARTEYLAALRASPEWRDQAAPAADESTSAAEQYRRDADATLRSLERDITNRAVTVGLVVGLNRNPLVDSLSILAAALELQLHVLTRLGKRPSLRVWMEMLKRTGGSLFLNWYVSREDALYLKLAIKKTAWGMTAASDLAQHAADAIDDVDWHEVLGSGGGVPGLHLLGTVTASGLGIGAFGLRHLGNFIESTADDLLQGVLASGVLYFHGMSLAADCLAMDQEHRRSAGMNRTVSQAMTVALAPAANLLRDQVRALRQFLRERRRMGLAAAREKLKQGAGSAIGTARGASLSVFGKMRAAVRRSGSRPQPEAPGDSI